MPGFVDIHVHGGGGGSFTAGDDVDAKRAVEFHASRGTTTMLGSLVTAAAEELRRSVAILAELVDDGFLAGSISRVPGCRSVATVPMRRGSYAIRIQTSCVVAQDRTGGTIKMITLAPKGQVRWMRSRSLLITVQSWHSAHRCPLRCDARCSRRGAGRHSPVQCNATYPP